MTHSRAAAETARASVAANLASPFNWRRLSLVQCALLSRLAVWLLAILAFNTCSVYDSSQQLQRQAAEQCSSSRLDSLVNSLFAPFAHWDALHQLAIAQYGYASEQQTAFFPLFPMVLRGAGEILHSITFESLCRYHCVLVAGFVINAMCTIANCLLLQRVILQLTHKSQVARTAALLFCLSPASIFQSALYTEPLFTMLGLWSLLQLDHNHSWRASVLMSLQSATRSNGMMSSLFIALHQMSRLGSIWFTTVLPQVESHDRKEAKHATRRITRQRVYRSLALIAETAAQGLLIVAPYCAFQFYAAAQFCPQSAAPYCDAPRHWLLGYLIPPSVYSHVQSKYWNVGLFRYYTLAQLPQFVLAAPVLAVAIHAIRTVIQQHQQNTIDLMSRLRMNPVVANERENRSECNSQPQDWDTKAVPQFKLLAHTCHLAVLVGVCLTVLHVQVSTRFLLSSAAPMMYAHMAHLCLSSRRAMKLILAWSALYASLGTILFACFLPWT